VTEKLTAAPTKKASVMSSTDFRLSRIYAEGWNTAQKLSAEETDDLDSKQASLNPYTSDPEKSRWNDGFAKAAPKPR